MIVSYKIMMEPPAARINPDKIWVKERGSDPTRREKPHCKHQHCIQSARCMNIDGCQLFIPELVLCSEYSDAMSSPYSKFFEREIRKLQITLCAHQRTYIE